ncbi:MAG TPA: succinate dehydrogenase assembly factor 2 [Gammaproteobacteria bacterium]|jgi:antitoxin CptB
MAEHNELARVRWRCRRGMRELDGVLEAFLAGSFAALSTADKSRFAALLELPDPDLYAYLCGRMEPEDESSAALIARIRAAAARA